MQTCARTRVHYGTPSVFEPQFRMWLAVTAYVNSILKVNSMQKLMFANKIVHKIAIYEISDIIIGFIQWLVVFLLLQIPIKSYSIIGTTK